MQDDGKRGQIRIREMREEEAGRVIVMIAALSAHEGAPPPPLTAEELLRWSLGADARFHALVAVRGGNPVGYALFHDSFHIGRSRPGSVLMDLFVDRGHRRRGIARALLAAVAHATQERQGDWITWQAHPRNIEALAFYEAIGARRFAAADFELADGAMEGLILP